MKAAARMSLVAVAMAIAGCDCGAPPLPGGDPDGGVTVLPDGAVQLSDGGIAPSAPFPKADACQVLKSQAALGNRPVDVIMIIDNSGSMTLEIQAVENNVNTNFAQIIAASGLDYRVILIAKHGSAAGDQSVCIKSPLSANTCMPPGAQPVNGARFFHYDTEISSVNGLQRMLATYDVTDTHNFAPGGWKTWLRPDSFKSILLITDDESNLTADQFETQLFAKASADFGSAAARRYIFHGIIGIVANTPTTAAWQPTDPKKSAKCASAAQPGVRYEDLAIRTGGIRFPVCETANYDAAFRAAAQGVIASAELACDFQPPPPPAGQNYRDSYVEYTPGGGGAIQYLRSVPTGGTCGSNYYTLSPQTGRVQLCPEACARVKADTSAKLEVAYACGIPIN